MDAPKRLEYKLDDDRMVELILAATENGTHMKQTFDAEIETDVEMQRIGWQSILDNFARHADNN
jgi:hypothetical protein